MSGVVGETIFEEDDDLDDKTPIASLDSWTFRAGISWGRAEGAHDRSVEDASEETRTWPGRVKREDVDVQGVDWGNERVRRRGKGKGIAA